MFGTTKKVVAAVAELGRSIDRCVAFLGALGSDVRALRRDIARLERRVHELRERVSWPPDPMPLPELVPEPSEDDETPPR